jgi:hypothetical protein
MIFGTPCHVSVIPSLRAGKPRPEALSTVTTWIGEISAQWDQRLAALRSYLLEEPGTSSAQEQETNASANTRREERGE